MTRLLLLILAARSVAQVLSQVLRGYYSIVIHDGIAGHCVNILVSICFMLTKLPALSNRQKPAPYPAWPPSSIPPPSIKPLFHAYMIMAFAVSEACVLESSPLPLLFLVLTFCLFFFSRGMD